MTLAEALRQAAAQGAARLDAQLLLLHALGRSGQDRAWLIAHDTDLLRPGEAAAFSALCARRAAGEPIAYLVGSKEFFGLPLAVDARVLVPRPETELLVEWALELMAARPAPRVVDLGTGSGAIALAFARQRPDATVLATDRSEGALAVARANAAALGVAVAFHQGNWLAAVDGDFDLIVSNPPYVAHADPHLEALRHEPLTALAAGPDGLDDLRAIVATALPRLRPGGWLLLEHGHDQAAAVRDLLKPPGFAEVATRTDLAGIPRATGGQRLELG